MGEHKGSREIFRVVADEVRERGGSTTSVGEQRVRAGEGLNPLVDPKGFGVIRRSITRMDKVGDCFVSKCGLAMLVESCFDTTASMGGNVDLAFRSLPDLYELLEDQEFGVLRRYDPQLIMGNFNDQLEYPVLCRSQAEMGVKIAEELTMLVPIRNGGDDPEDPEYGILSGAYLTASHARAFGLKSYYFTITDAPGRGRLDPTVLTGIFGDEVYERIRENGFQIDPRSLPDTAGLVAELLKTSHAFLLQVGDRSNTTDFWTEAFGTERIVILPRTELLAQVQAAIIGLTEGTLDLQNLQEWLIKHAGANATDARSIQRAVAGIPIGAQMAMPNFNRVFSKGAKFAKKGDVFPIGFKPDLKEKGVKKPESAHDKKKPMWH